MANYFVNLPKPEGRNSLLDLAPINNALSDVSRQNNLNRQRQDMLDERAYQRGRDAKQDARVAEADSRTRVEWFGKQAAAIERMQGPQRQAAWQRVLMRHPDHANLPKEYIDPMTGPALIAAEAGQWRDPRDDQMKDLDLDYRRAQIGKLDREAATGGDLPSNVREWKFYNALPEDRRAEYLRMKRATENRVVGDSIINLGTGEDIRSVGEAKSQGKLAENLGSEGAKYIMGKPREDAQAAASTVTNMHNARELLNSGIIAGKGAGLITSAKGWFDTMGILGDTDQELVANTQAYAAQMGREVGNVIRAFGSGTGLSDADREYAQSIAGGNIELTLPALKKITEINERLARAKIKTYNDMVGRVQRGLSPFPLEIETPGGNELPKPDQGISADGWTQIGNGVRIREKR